MSYQFICYPKCTTCQRARRWLMEHDVPFAERDIKSDRPTAGELESWYRESGLPLKKFFNTSGLLYKSLALREKLPGMDEQEQKGVTVPKRAAMQFAPIPEKCVMIFLLRSGGK